MFYSYPSSKLLSVRRHARFDIEMEIAFERRRRNRKLVLKREFSLMCAKHETDRRVVVVPILPQFDIIHDGEGVIEPVNLLCVWVIGK